MCYVVGGKIVFEQNFTAKRIMLSFVSHPSLFLLRANDVSSQHQWFVHFPPLNLAQNCAAEICSGPPFVYVANRCRARGVPRVLEVSAFGWRVGRCGLALCAVRIWEGLTRKMTIWRHFAVGE